MEGIYPVIVDGALVGKLTVSKIGALTSFDVRCRELPGIVRLSVYGEGREGCLGVLVPEDDGLALHKKLSRNALREFPSCIDSVERAGRPPEQQLSPEMPEREPEAVPVFAPAPQPKPEPEPEASEPLPAPSPAELPPEPPEEDGLFWYASPDGALVCFDGVRSLIALPVGDERIPEEFGGTLRLVEGREYMIYRTKNGRLVRD